MKKNGSCLYLADLPAVLAPGCTMNVERSTMDGGQQPLFLSGTSGWAGSISGPQQSTVQTAGAPSEHYGGPLSLSICITDSGHEILRPKPRRWAHSSLFFKVAWLCLSGRARARASDQSTPILIKIWLMIINLPGNPLRFAR